MALLVLHDLGRMPRTRAALAGEDPARPWDELNTQLALLDSRLQFVLRVLWVGLRLEGDPPPSTTYPVPGADEQPQGSPQGPPRMDPRHREYLDRFAPQH
ncbi:hypothetical protein GCM10027294_43820 [Marinactinospora endophytica]